MGAGFFKYYNTKFDKKQHGAGRKITVDKYVTIGYNLVTIRELWEERSMKAIQRIGALLLSLAITVCLLGGLSPRAEAAEYKTAIGTVTAGSLRLRERADIGSDILATAHRNDKVVVIDHTGSWYKVVYNLETGYMHEDYLELDEVKNVKLGYDVSFSIGSHMRSDGRDLSRQTIFSMSS